MVSRIEVGFKKGIRDALGEKTKNRIVDNFSLPVTDVRTIDVYTVAGDLTKEELKKAAAGPFSDPVIQHCSINKPLAKDFNWLIEVASGRASRTMWAKPRAKPLNYYWGIRRVHAKSPSIRRASI